MPDTTTTITLSAALIAGLAGSAHCFGMCGGFAVALGMRSRVAAGNALALRHALLTHLGRLAGYTLAGALFGLFGATLQSVLDLRQLSVLLRIASGILLVLVAIRMLFSWNGLGWLERLGARLWGRIQPLARFAASGGGTGGTLLLGFLWGWLPCGLVYSMLLFAALSGNALTGAMIMLAFGAGTLPSMLTSSALASQMHRWLAQRWPRFISGAALLVFGVWLAYGALRASPHGHHHAPAHTGHSTQRVPAEGHAHSGTDNTAPTAADSVAPEHAGHSMHETVSVDHAHPDAENATAPATQAMHASEHAGYPPET